MKNEEKIIEIAFELYDVTDSLQAGKPPYPDGLVDFYKGMREKAILDIRRLAKELYEATTEK